MRCGRPFEIVLKVRVTADQTGLGHAWNARQAEVAEALAGSGAQGAG